jgi:hypothetical protein
VQLLRIYTLQLTIAATTVRYDVEQIVDAGADWIWRGVNIDASVPAEFRLRMQAEDYFLSNVRMEGRVFEGQIKAWPGGIRIPGGGRVGLEAENIGAAAITVQIMLIGVKEVPV